MYSGHLKECCDTAHTSLDGGGALDTIPLHGTVPKLRQRDNFSLAFSLLFAPSSEIGVLIKTTRFCPHSHVVNVLFAKHPNTPMTAKREEKSLQAMKEFYRQLAHGCRK